MERSDLDTRRTEHERQFNNSSEFAAMGKVRKPFLKWALYGIVLLAVACAFFVWVLVPVFQPPIDPNLKDLTIERINQIGLSERQSGFEKRGSVTDKLFDESASSPGHPLDPVLSVAREGLKRIQTDVRDYTALMVKQERVNGTLLGEEMMRVKVRHESSDAQAEVPRSFYLKFESPQSITGREVIWVQGRNNDKLVAHEGAINLLRFHLAPDSFLAMVGNRYPITELGIETLIQRMIEKGERDLQHEECAVTIDRNVKIDGHKCTLITITHPQKRNHFEFFQARIYVDDEINLPVGYEGFLWPDSPGGEPVLIERYFYRELLINPGLGDIDFDPENPDYKFP